jgi:RNA polymerase sigma factor (sigma-70 family)
MTSTRPPDGAATTAGMHGDGVDDRLAARARDGDLAAWAEVVARHQAPAFQVACLVARSSDDAAGLVRGAFVRAYHALGSKRDDQSLRGWLMRIVAGEARTRRRDPALERRPRRRPSPARGAPAVQVPGAPLAPEEAATLADALERLPDDDRLVVGCAHLLGMEPDEAAQVLGTDAAAVAERHETAMRTLRRRLGGDATTGPPGPAVRLVGLDDPELGRLVAWAAAQRAGPTPDLVAEVVDRLERDVLAYPERFARTQAAAEATGPRPRGRRRGARRWLVLVASLAVIGVLAFVGLADRPVPAPVTAPDGADLPPDGAEEAPDAAGRASDGTVIALRPVLDGLDRPVFVTGASDGSGRLFVVEQDGRVLASSAEGAPPALVLDLRDRVRAGGERGLLGLAFHPGFAANGRVFVHYTRAPDGASVVSELGLVGERADPASERVLLVVEQPAANHNGGMLAFDLDGFLLVGLGDGGGGADPLDSGQDAGTLLGAILRLDVDGEEPYAIPPDNGLVGVEGARPEVHAIGLRNPWRFSVDPATGDVLIGEVGESGWEEIDRLPAGQGGLDFGWAEMEGPDCFRQGCDPAAHEPPVVAYRHDEGCSVIGGHVHRGTRHPSLAGLYLFGDYCSGTIWAVDAAALADGTHRAADGTPRVDVITGRAQVVGRLDGAISSFGVDDDGEVYVVDIGGRVLRIEAG